ncbi:MAG: hypothetical protein ACRDJ2_07140 [Actinomycetota bacterium]
MHGALPRTAVAWWPAASAAAWDAHRGVLADGEREVDVLREGRSSSISEKL